MLQSASGGECASFLIFAALLVLAACQQKAAQQPANEPCGSGPGESRSKACTATLPASRRPPPTFKDPDGKPVKLADFKGKPVLVNLWATWCAPCVKELPTLDKLRALSGAAQRGRGQPGHAARMRRSSRSSRAHRIATLEPYQDRQMGLSGALGPDTVLPTSILFDANGKEVWRYVGDLDWTSPEAAKLLAEAGAATKAG